MAPKSSKVAHDDTKPENTITKEKHTSGSGSHSNGKLRRVASSTGSQLREVTNANASADAPAPAKETAQNPGVRIHLIPSTSLYPRRHLSLVKLPANFVVPRFNGKPLSETHSMRTVANTTSTLLPPSPARTVNWSFRDPVALAYTPQRWPGRRRIEGRAKSN